MRAAQRLVGTAAVVADDDAVDAVLKAQRRVLARLDAFQQHLHLRRAFEPLDVVPAQAAEPHAHLRHVDAVEHAPHLERIGRHAGVARLADGIVVAIEALERFEIARRNVDGPGERRAAGVLGALQHALRRRPVRRRVELKPTRPAARRRDVLDGEVRDGREYLQRVLALGRARDGDFALGVEHELRADGAEHDRRAQALAEHVDGQIDGADVDEPPRPQADLLERRRGSRRSCRGRRSLARCTRSGRRSSCSRIAVSKSQTLTACVRARDDAVEVERAGEHRVVLARARPLPPSVPPRP